VRDGDNRGYLHVVPVSTCIAIPSPMRNFWDVTEDAINRFRYRVGISKVPNKVRYLGHQSCGLPII
jgi:hypothetical protein